MSLIIIITLVVVIIILLDIIYIYIRAIDSNIITIIYHDIFLHYMLVI